MYIPKGMSASIIGSATELYNCGKNMAEAHEEEVLGKAYDSRLMKRLLTYLRPYRRQVSLAMVAILCKAFMDVVGPYLMKTAVDKYLVHSNASVPGFLDRWLSPQAWTGIAQISALYIGVLASGFLFDSIESYTKQWVGQKARVHLRTQIFGHTQQMHAASSTVTPWAAL